MEKTSTPQALPPAKFNRKPGPLASIAAARANGGAFSTRRGVYQIERPHGTVVIYFDNNPNDGRDALLRSIVDSVEAVGGDLCDEGFYPEQGEDARYTVALVFDPGGATPELIEQAIEEAAAEHGAALNQNIA